MNDLILKGNKIEHLYKLVLNQCKPHCSKCIKLQKILKEILEYD